MKLQRGPYALVGTLNWCGILYGGSIVRSFKQMGREGVRDERGERERGEIDAPSDSSSD